MINDHKIYIIVATDQKLGIGKGGKMPWHLKNELKYFQEITGKTKDLDKQNMVLMGRTTWESIPSAHRPLPNRKNVVLTRNPKYEAEGAEVQYSLDDALNLADERIESIFVIGGGKVFEEMLDSPLLDGIYLTHIHKEFECDTFFPILPERFSEPENLGDCDENGIQYNYLFYPRLG